MEKNELDIMPLRAAGLEELADKIPFNFENSEFLRFVLKAAGFEQIIIRPCDRAVSSGGWRQ